MKKRIKMLTAALCAVVLLCSFSVTAYAGGGPEWDGLDPAEETTNPEPTIEPGEGFTEESLNALQTGELDSFKSGELGWLPGSSYTMNELRETAPDVYEHVAVAPAIADAAPNMYIESLAVSGQSENRATALAFAAFVTNPENQREFAEQASVFPSTDGALDDPYFTEDDGSDDAGIRVQSAAQVKEAVVWWPPAFSGESSAEFLREQIAQAVLGQKSAQDALDAAVEYADQRLESSN